MAHRLREAWDSAQARFSGPVDVDECYVGGLGRDKHQTKKPNLAARGRNGFPERRVKEWEQRRGGADLVPTAGLAA